MITALETTLRATCSAVALLISGAAYAADRAPVPAAPADAKPCAASVLFNPDATTSLLFGAGRSAISCRVTPTCNFDRFFVRGEYSYVDLCGIQLGNLAAGTLGTGFGRTGNVRSQDRYMLGTGFAL